MACAAAAAALTFFGIALPLLSSETASTVMFLAGAIVTLMALRPPYALAAEATASVPSIPRAEPRFAELIDGVDRAAALDRASWARLTAHMSHELRTPLNAVLGFSELMSKEVFGPMGASCYGDYARGIHASGRLLLKSAEDALAITALLTAAPVKGASPTCGLGACLDDALAFHGTEIADRAIAVTTGFMDDDLILADAQTVRQLLINLVAEALDRAADRAEIDVTMALRDGALRVAVALSQQAVAAPPGSFNMQLARTLADLSGAQIAEARSSGGGATLTVAFAPAAQRDFFATH
ncbi:MAG: sensor histidine kinase [Hyphomicrobium sp.]